MKNSTIPSIQSKLIKWLTIPLALFTLVLFSIIYYVLYTQVNSFFDDRLFATAKSIEQSIGVENSKVVVDFPRFSIDLLSSNDEGLVYYSVLDDENSLLIGHKYLSDKRILKRKTKHFFTTKFDGEKLRAVIYKASIYSSGKNYNAYITVAETNEERDSNITKILFFLSIIIVVVILFTLVISLFAVKKGLNPLHKLEKIIKKRDKRDLSAIEFNAPREIEDVLNSINILLQRSRDNIDYIEQFNSDVSHQLRTPLAELKVKIEEHYNKDDKEYISMMSLINSMGHITEQLLLYAKTNPNTINLNRFENINLNAFVKEYCLKTAPRVYTKGFEFAFIDMDESVDINADKVLLESMLDNIVNNALYYAVDELNNPMGTISIGLEKKQNHINLYVKDEGNGLEQEHLKNIFKRAYRVDTKTKGTGLGLSIVRQIALLHKAKVKAYNDEGLVINISFLTNDCRF